MLAGTSAFLYLPWKPSLRRALSSQTNSLGHPGEVRPDAAQTFWHGAQARLRPVPGQLHGTGPVPADRQGDISRRDRCRALARSGRTRYQEGPLDSRPGPWSSIAPPVLRGIPRGEPQDRQTVGRDVPPEHVRLSAGLSSEFVFDCSPDPVGDRPVISGRAISDLA